MELGATVVETLSQLNEHQLIAAFLVIVGLAVVAIALRTASTEWEAREALEQRYAALMENVAEGVMLVKASDGQIIEANPSAARLADRDAGELRGMKTTEVFPADGPAHWLKEVRALGRASLTALSLRRKSGTSVPVDVEATTFRQGRERIVQLIIRPVAPPSRPEPRLVGLPATGAPAMPSLPMMPVQPEARVIPQPVPTFATTPPPVARPGHAVSEERPALRRVLEVVAEQYKVPVSELIGTRNTPELTLARRVAMYLATHKAELSAAETGRALGGRSEVAVIYGARYVADAMEQDWSLRRQVEEMAAQLSQVESAARARRT
jgi:PAS domain S-box-containing protein